LRITVQKLADDSKPDKPVKAAPPPKGNKSVLSRLGLTLGQLDNAGRAKFTIGGAVKGVLVTDVDPSSPAAGKNVRAGDVIVEVAGQAVTSPDQAARRLEADTKAGKKVELFLINRGGDLTYVGLRLK
jgi:serine protease Do